MRPFALLCTLVLALLLAWTGSRTPAPLPADAPAARVSAGRAMADVRAIASRPHPVASPAQAAVIDTLERRMTALGLGPRRSTGFALETRRDGDRAFGAGATVTSLVGVLPGRERGLAPIAVMAHTDAVPHSPGAADDAAGVAAALELVRALKAAGPQRRDLLVLLTDGEEAGLLGARQLWRDDPAVRRAAAVVNLEARGAGGRALLFETGRDDDAPVTAYAAGARTPSASSLSAFLYQILPNDTDFSVPRDAGQRGLNIAFIGRSVHYHAASSTPERLEPGALQHLADQAQAAVGGLLNAPPEALEQRGGVAVFQDVFGLALLRWAPPFGWLIAGGAAVGIVGAAAVLRARGELRWGAVLRGALAGLWLLAAGVAVFRGLRLGTGAPFDFLGLREITARQDAYEAMLATAGLALLLGLPVLDRLGRWAATGVAAALAGALVAVTGLDLLTAGAAVAAVVLTPLRPRGAAEPGDGVGLALLGLLLAVAVQAAAPTAAALLLLCSAAVAVGLLAAAVLGRPLGLAAGALCAAVAAGMVLQTGHLLLVALGAAQAEALAAVLLLLATALSPLLIPRRGEQATAGRVAAAAPALLALAAAAAALALRVTDWATPDTPRPLQVFLWAEDGRLWRASGLAPDHPWTRAALGLPPGRSPEELERTPLFGRVWRAPAAEAAALPAPTVQVTRQADGRRLLLLSGAPTLRIDVQADSPFTLEQAQGRAAPGAAALRRLSLRVDGATEPLRLLIRGGGPLRLTAAAVTPWPAQVSAPPAFPRDGAPSGAHGGAMSVVRATAP